MICFFISKMLCCCFICRNNRYDCYVKVEDAIVLALAQQRRPNSARLSISGVVSPIDMHVVYKILLLDL